MNKAFQKTKKQLLGELLILIAMLFLPGQFLFGQKHTISGYVIDMKSGEALVGATIWDEISRTGAMTNTYGLFQLLLPEGQRQLYFKYVGFNERQLLIQLKNDTLINIALSTNNLLEEVVISENGGQEFLLSPSMSMYRLQATQLNQVPSMLGEADILKVIQMLPGVSMTTEGKAGISVRGGSTDQTLILLDGVPVYNVNHLFGYLSTFNSDIINSATLYKGGLPSRYGDRLSSVLDITTKEGNLNGKAGTISIGTMAGRLYLEGPLKKGKISYALAARRTWLDLPIHLGQMMNYDEEISYGFWDINGKLNWKINDRNRVFFSCYSGKDAFLHKSKGFFSKDDNFDYRFSWQNQTAVLRWNLIPNSRLFVNTSVYISRYTQEQKNISDKKTDSYQRVYNDLNDYSILSDFNYTPSESNVIKFGYHFSKQKFSPEIIEFKEADSLTSLNKDAYINSSTLTGYFEDDWILSEKVKLYYGLRGSWYYGGGADYLGAEPRLAISYHFKPHFTLKLSYSRMKQFLHMLNNNSIGIPVDMWVSSTAKIKPESSYLLSAGLFYQKTNEYNFSAECYYTNMKHVIHYIEGAEYYKLIGHSWESYVTSGKGDAYGVELFAEKKNGALTGWASYTLSWSNRIFADLNNGKPFPYDYDRRHQLKLFANYQLFEKEKKNKKINHSISSSLVVLSGNYISFPTQEYHAVSLPFYGYGEDNSFLTRKYTAGINNLKMPPFHHLDIAYQIKMEKNGKTNCWDFSIYNVYNHKNVYYYYKSKGKIKQVSFFPILPSVTYTRKF
jgi:outer membrane receptor for ferrienterochelin and colicin